MTRFRRVAPLSLSLLALVAAACSNVNPSTTARANGSGVSHVYVAIGENGSKGFRSTSDVASTWTLSFYRSGLGTRGTLYDLSMRAQTVADALVNVLPHALALHPDLVTVWVSTEDIVSGTPLASYGQDLAQLVAALRDEGATVLLANAPPPVLFPALEGCPGGIDGCGPGGPAPPPDVAATVTAYDSTIASIARQTGARLVDVEGALSSAAAGSAGSVLSEDGSSLSPAGAALVARAFLHALPARFRHAD
jgi:lysophospholipase L1-like esterase